MHSSAFVVECYSHISKSSQPPIDRVDRSSCPTFWSFTLQKKCRSQYERKNLMLPFHCDFKDAVNIYHCTHSKLNLCTLEFCVRGKDFPIQISLKLKLATWICLEDQQKAVLYENYLFVTSSSYISMLLPLDLFLENFTWLQIKSLFKQFTQIMSNSDVTTIPNLGNFFDHSFMIIVE